MHRATGGADDTLGRENSCVCLLEMPNPVDE